MANYDTCKECGAPLHSDDIAIYRKMVLRCAQEFMCIDCLAKYLGVSREAIEERIRYYRESGTCVLFR
jgi:biotin operon repressor